MRYFLFSDAEVWQREIKAGTFIGALRKAKETFGIKVPLRCIKVDCGSRVYSASITGYECVLRRVD